MKGVVDKCLKKTRLETEVKDVKKRCNNKIDKEVMKHMIITSCYRFDFYIHEVALTLELIYRLDKIDKDKACAYMVIDLQNEKRLETFSELGENINIISNLRKKYLIIFTML